MNIIGTTRSRELTSVNCVCISFARFVLFLWPGWRLQSSEKRFNTATDYLVVGFIIGEGDAAAMAATGRPGSVLPLESYIHPNKFWRSRQFIATYETYNAYRQRLSSGLRKQTANCLLLRPHLFFTYFREICHNATANL